MENKRKREGLGKLDTCGVGWEKGHFCPIKLYVLTLNLGDLI